MDGGIADARDLPAEVSGWDSNENFFVEQTRLCWSREGKHEIAVHRSVRVGCVVFLRLLRQFADPVDFPIAYRVDQTEGPASGTETRVFLSRLHPKAPFRESARFVSAENLQVA